MMQYQLPISLQPHATFDNYYCNSGYTEALINQLQQKTVPTIITGRQGSGKTHLLQAACHHHKNNWLFLDCNKLENTEPTLIENLEGQLLCLDNIEQLFQQRKWEDALFKLFLLNHNQFLCSSNSSSINTYRKDLQSRFQAMLTLTLPTLSEQDQFNALQQKIIKKGLNFPNSLILWMQKNLPRDNTFLFNFIDEIEKESLRSLKKPCVPLAKNLFHSKLNPV